MPPGPSERIWYVVMNTSRARIIRELPGARNQAAAEITMQSARRNLRDILHNKPTRSFASARDGRRSGVEPGADPLQEDARAFLREVLGFLDEQYRLHAFDGLVLIAPSGCVGLWRTELPGTLRECVRQEFQKNLVRLSSGELAAAVRALVSG
ncbi:host attachment protein [Leisingera aquaemixtae]|uniref:host attachment protein n=2 Tax=Leisingera TaxID=191028 RepID=UPI001CF8026E|nr:host attachment protein [Leisingera aquaemixtae]MCB4457878.1 host attachment protein [Leisingera sp. McT4-56]